MGVTGIYKTTSETVMRSNSIVVLSHPKDIIHTLIVAQKQGLQLIKDYILLVPQTSSSNFAYGQEGIFTYGIDFYKEGQKLTRFFLKNNPLNPSQA